MAARIPLPYDSRKKGNRSYEELKKLLQKQSLSGNSPANKGNVVLKRKIDVPADTNSASKRGTVTPPQSNRGVVPRVDPQLGRKVTPATKKALAARPQEGAPNTYTNKQGRTYIKNPTNSTAIWLKNHPIFASRKGPVAKAQFLKNHPNMAKRAGQVSKGGTLPYKDPTNITNVKGPALTKAPDNYRAALLRRLAKAKKGKR